MDGGAGRPGGGRDRLDGSTMKRGTTMRGKTSAIILAGGFLLATLECKSGTKDQPAPVKAAAPAAPAAAAAARAAPEPKPAAPGVDPRGTDFQPFPVGKRPGCKPVPRVVTTAEGAMNFRWRAPLARTWALVSYGRSTAFEALVDVDAERPVGENDVQQMQGDYFSGLKPGSLANVVYAGETKASAIRTKYYDGRHLRFLKSFAAIEPGYFSDHCYDAGGDDNALLFSILLSEDIALQLRAQWRDFDPREEDHYIDRGEGYGESDPVDPIPRKVYNTFSLDDRRFRRPARFALFTVSLKDGHVVDAKFSEPIPDKANLTRFQPGDFSIAVIGKGDQSPVAISLDHVNMVAIVKRDGRIPVFRTVRCASSAKNYWSNAEISPDHVNVRTVEEGGRYRLHLSSGITHEPSKHQTCPEGDVLEREAGLAAPAKAAP
jgi:hypothetical protein